MTTLDLGGPDGRYLVMAIRLIVEQISPEDRVVSVLVGTQSPTGEEIHYYVTAGKPDVQRVLMLPDSPAAGAARELLAQASVRLDVPDTP